MANSGLNISGIYKIESKVHPERIYIGSAVNLRHRKNRHFLTLEKNIHKNPKLQAHYNKYGEKDLIFSVITICDRKELMPINGIIRPEQFFIWAYDPWFNINKIAGSCMGVKRSKEICIKIGNAKRGKPSPKKGKPSGVIPWNKGLKGAFKHTEEFKKQRSESMQGEKHHLFGTHPSEETRKKLIESHRGHKDSEETKKKKSEAHMGKNKWNKGRKHSEETCKKRSISIQKWWDERRKVC